MIQVAINDYQFPYSFIRNAPQSITEQLPWRPPWTWFCGWNASPFSRQTLTRPSLNPRLKRDSSEKMIRDQCPTTSQFLTLVHQSTRLALFSLDIIGFFLANRLNMPMECSLRCAVLLHMGDADPGPVNVCQWLKPAFTTQASQRSIITSCGFSSFSRSHFFSGIAI